MDSIAHSMATCPTPPHRALRDVKTHRASSRAAIARSKPKSHRTEEYTYTCMSCSDTFPSTHAPATPDSASPASSGPFLIDTDENARIVCPFCLKDFETLSSCWNCTGAVLKGDKKVSLALTLWHRSCFVCTFCKVSLKVPGGEGEHSVEVFDLPTCADCAGSWQGTTEVSPAKKGVGFGEDEILGDDGPIDRKKDDTARVAVIGEPKSARKILGLGNWARRGKGGKIVEESGSGKQQNTGQTVHRSDSQRAALVNRPLPNSNLALSTEVPVGDGSIPDPMDTPASKHVYMLKAPPKWMVGTPKNMHEGRLQQPIPTKSLPHSRSVLSFFTSSGDTAQPTVTQKRNALEKLEEVLPRVRFQETKRTRSPYERPVSRKKVKTRMPSPVPPGMCARKQLTSYACDAETPAIEVQPTPSSKKTSALLPNTDTNNKPVRPSILPVEPNKTSKVHAIPGQNVNSFQSTEFLERCRMLRHSVSIRNLVQDTKGMCPCCGKEVEGGRSSIHGQDKQRYHVSCFVCRICDVKLNPTTKHDDYLYLEKLPYHRKCVAAAVGTSIASSAQKPVGSHDGQGQELGQSKSTFTLATLAKGVQPNQAERRPPLTPGPHPMQKALARGPPSALCLPKSVSVWTMSGKYESTCAACGEIIGFLDEVPGPKREKFHWTCMKCHGCETLMGDDGTRWYEWDPHGMMAPFCRDCWRNGRKERGYTIEQIDRDELDLVRH